MDVKLSYRGRDMELLRMGFRSYRAYLESPLWAGIRQRVFECWGEACWVCGREDCRVAAHHLHYTHGNLSGRHIRGIRPVCPSCHVACEFVEVGGRCVKRRAVDVGMATVRLREKSRRKG